MNPDPFNALLSRGHATAQEILALGIDPALLAGSTALPPFPIDLQVLLSTGDVGLITGQKIPSWNDLKKVSATDHAELLKWLFKERPIISGKLFPDQIEKKFQDSVSLMGHEAVHVLQGMAYALDGFLLPKHHGRNIGDDVSDGHGPQFEKILAGEENVFTRALRHWKLQRSIEQNDRFISLYPFLYPEIQARLHEIAAGAIPQGKPFPRSKQDLVNLIDEGTKRFFNQYTEGVSAQNQSYTRADAAAGELRFAVIGKLSPKQSKDFINEVLPEVYGSLLELYGDPEGKVKMGLQSGPVWGRAIAARMLYETTVSDAEKWTPQKWQEMAAHVEPGLEERLIVLARVTGHDLAGDALRLDRLGLKGVQFDRARSQTLEPHGLAKEYR